jgi:hypothetical protein
MKMYIELQIVIGWLYAIYILTRPLVYYDYTKTNVEIFTLNLYPYVRNVVF